MAYERIDNLVTNEDFCFQAWDDRYGRGIWVALGLYELQIDVVRDLSGDGDLDALPATDYVFSADWLPYVTGRTLADAMQKLEDRLAALPADQLTRKSPWATMVSDAIELLRDTTLGKSYYGSGDSPDSLPDLPKTFAEAIKAVRYFGYVPPSVET